MRANSGPKGIGELLGPREEAKIACPPNLHGPPWAPQHPIRRKVKKAGKGRQRRNAGRRGFLSTGRLALHYLRYFTAGEVANALPQFAGLGETIVNLAHIMELAVVRHVGGASRREKDQNADGASVFMWAFFARNLLSRIAKDRDTVSATERPNFTIGPAPRPPLRKAHFPPPPEAASKLLSQPKTTTSWRPTFTTAEMESRG